jgi:uncharacterized Zn finger protein
VSPRRDFGLTWWGRAWIEAIEERARLDPSRLPRGRAYARRDHVLSISADPGAVTALVEGSRLQPYRVVLRVREFTDDEWDRVIDGITARAGHAAALLDGDLLPEILDDVADGGVDLLPGPGELGPQCTCPDAADPCKHAAAVCYLFASMLDEDPFVLFHLRGRDRSRLLADVRTWRGRSGAGARGRAGAPVDGGRTPELRRVPVTTVVASTAHARVPTTLADLRALDLRPTTERPGQPQALSVGPPIESGVRSGDLELLAANAADRAFALATGVDDGHALDEWEDIARWAARTLGTPRFGALAAHADVPARRLTRWALAWQAGGREGLAVSEGTPPPGVAPEDLGAPPPTSAVAAARAALAGIEGERSVRVQGDRVAAGAVQLRWGPSGRWYRFEKVGGQWQAAGPPAADPAALIRPR